MSDAPQAAGAPAGKWFLGRPRSWAFFAVGSAFAAVLSWAPFLLWSWPATPGRWLVSFVGVWAATAASFLFRDPFLDNPFARRLAARTDAGASGARVMYLLGVSILAGALLMGALLLIEPHLPSAVTGR